jgi:hypothetical protein
MLRANLVRRIGSFDALEWQRASEALREATRTIAGTAAEREFHAYARFNTTPQRGVFGSRQASRQSPQLRQFDIGVPIRNLHDRRSRSRSVAADQACQSAPRNVR